MFDNIFIFVKLVELGSFIKTAHYFRTTKSTISRKIQGLEEYLNKQLLIRNAKKIELTNSGDYLFAKFKHLQDAMSETIQHFNPVQIKNNGELNISLPTMLSKNLITPYIGYFIKQNPHIKLNIVYQHSKPDLDKFDLIITTAYKEQTDSKLYDLRFIRSEYIQLYCTPDYSKKYGLPLTIEDLSLHHVIGGIEPTTHEVQNRVTFTHRYTKEKFTANLSNSRIKMSLVEHVISTGLQYDYIFWGWGYQCEKLMRTGQVIQVLPEYILEGIDYYIISKKFITQEEQLFIDFIYRCMNKKIELDMQSTGFDVINEDNY